MQTAEIRHPETGRTRLIYPTPSALAKYEAQGWDVSAAKPKAKRKRTSKAKQEE